MPIPVLRIDDPAHGLPRQPVPLRLAYLVTRLDFSGFMFLLAERQEKRYEYLAGYEHTPGETPRDVGPEDYEKIRRAGPLDASKAELVTLLPPDHFVWSDELAGAFSDFVRDCPGEEAAQAQGMGLSWTPAFGDLRPLIEECVDLSDLAPATPATALSQRDLRKRETQDRYARWREAYDELKPQHPDKSDSWISEKIAKLPVADGQSAETIRRNMRRRK